MWVSRGFVIGKKKEAERVDSYIKRINIKNPSRKELVKNLSGNNQQKIAIAKALMIHPEVLIREYNSIKIWYRCCICTKRWNGVGCSKSFSRNGWCYIIVDTCRT